MKRRADPARETVRVYFAKAERKNVPVNNSLNAVVHEQNEERHDDLVLVLTSARVAPQVDLARFSYLRNNVDVVVQHTENRVRAGLNAIKDELGCSKDMFSTAFANDSE